MRYSTATEGPGPTIICRSGPACKVCSSPNTLVIHFPPFQFVSGDFKAVPWWEHEKYYCPACRFLWADWLDGKSLEEYGEEYVKANTDEQRRPAERRMCMAPELLLRLLCMTGGSRFLDYGVGYNVPYIYELRARGIDLWACDISVAVPYSRFVKRLPQETLPEGTFDGIYSLEVMEHLFHLHEDFLRMFRLLQPGGMMLHQTLLATDYWDGNPPFPRYYGLWDPYHVSVFSEDSARLVAEQVGLEYLGCVPTPRGKGLLFRRPWAGARKGKLSAWRPGTIWRCFKVIQHELYVQNHYGQTTPTLERLQRPLAFIARVRTRGLVGSVKRLAEKVMHRS